ncbi:hypothetical protein [Natrinema sp. 74]|uniref:DUF7544 domain-containing protein n=1 Tax=Natrinema sp. 74 TaxID=3384159 RepID=UPI0038D44366
MFAIDTLSDAIDVTREFFAPIDAAQWLRLAIVVLFVTSFGFGAPALSGGNVGPVTDGPVQDDGPSEIEEPAPTSQLLLWGLVVLAIFLVLWLGYEFLSAVMTFVFLESLRTGEVHIRRYFGTNTGRGLSLFLFRLGLGLAALLLLGVPILLVVFFAMGGQVTLLVGSALAFLPYAIIVGLLYGLLSQFTSAFVAPIMLLKDRGVLGAWRRFWGTLRPNWTEYLVYLLVVWILQLVAGSAVWIVAGLAALVLVVPFVIVIALLVFALGSLGALLSIPVGLLGALLGLLLFGAVWAPVAAYFQYYALLLLGDTNTALDLIPDRRAAAREGAANWRARPNDRDPTSRPDEFDDETGWDDDRGRDDPDDETDWGRSSGWDDTDDEDDDQNGGWR